ncbi:TPA: hypothetical protein NJ434_004020 [Vibrio parahaemolyticus]|nr:hypothetical protein [Vibrio parahaemolyticus]
MATTIQVVEDIPVGRFIEIEGKRCEVEAISFSQALTEKASQEELLKVMTEELLEQGLIAVDQVGAYYWKESGEYLIADSDYDDESDDQESA